MTELNAKLHDAPEGAFAPVIRRGFAMDRVKIDLKNCYGIKSLTREFDFSETRIYALYAPNGVMKSSLAQTFQDAAADRPSEDRIFKSRQTQRLILDEVGQEIKGERILVIVPYNEEFGVSEKTSTLLLDPKLKKSYDTLLQATDEAKTALLAAIKKQARTKRDLETEISSAIMQSADEIDAALTRVKREVDEQKENLFASVPYDTIFNEKVMAALNTKNLKAAIQDYIKQYNSLLAASTYFKRGTFDYYNAGQIAKSLTDNGFFDAQHTISLNSASAGNRTITKQSELEEVITDEKIAILSDKELRNKFDGVAAQLQKNAELRAFCAYIQNEEALLSRLDNPERLRQEVIKSYLKSNEKLYNDWIVRFDAAKNQLIELENIAKGQQNRWMKVVDIFNDRFVVPFKLEAKNKTEVTLGQASIIELRFTYVDGAESAEICKKELLQSLSTGERKALYILNVLFEIETRQKNSQETLIMVDDIADSFDYQNKYAIIQYLKDISEDRLFKLIIMTHNFDFFRTVESRIPVNYGNCLMASKGTSGVTLVQAEGIRNIFTRSWKKKFFQEDKKKIACIPFIRNLMGIIPLTQVDGFAPQQSQRCVLITLPVMTTNIRLSDAALPRFHSCSIRLIADDRRNAACDSRHFSKRNRLSFRNRRLPIPVLVAIALKSESIVMRIAVFASETAATSMSGESGAVLWRRRIVSYPADSSALHTDSGML